MVVSHQLNKRQILEEVALSLSVYVIYLVPSTVLQKKKKSIRCSFKILNGRKWKGVEREF